MLECRNCGGGLRYDIGSQKLVCDHCGSTFGTDESWKERVAVQAGPLTAGEDSDSAPEQDGYHVMLFTCPQCGGEITSYQNEATEFCSYCGASVTLAGRLVKEKQPEYIVPFSVTRENCIDAYRAHLKSLPFVPADLKKEETEQKFCGIYMPFWLYTVHQAGPLTLEGSRADGDYMEYCTLSAEIDTTYDRICYDASSAFEDTLAEAVAPFDFADAKDFNPAYLCGFYADRADVEAAVYQDKALGEAAEQTFQTLKGADPQYAEMKIGESEKRKIPGTVTGVKSALLPVWFMTWRTADRVSYSVVNGTTKKVTADVPVDKKKYLLASLVAGLAVAALLYFLLPVIIPEQSVRIAYVIAILGLWIYQSNFRARAKREGHDEDAGFTGAGAEFHEKKSFPVVKVAGILLLVFLVVAYISMEAGSGNDMTSLTISLFAHVDLVLYVVALLLHILMQKVLMEDYGRVRDRLMLRDTLPMIPAAILSVILLVMHPAQDYYYYAMTIVIGICLLNMLLGMIEQYNDLATRPLPVFHNRKRGDGNA